jgi:hypothetical protein
MSSVYLANCINEKYRLEKLYYHSRVTLTDDPDKQIYYVADIQVIIEEDYSIKSIMLLQGSKTIVGDFVNKVALVS